MSKRWSSKHQCLQSVRFGWQSCISNKRSDTVGPNPDITWYRRLNHGVYHDRMTSSYVAVFLFCNHRYFLSTIQTIEPISLEKRWITFIFPHLYKVGPEPIVINGVTGGPYKRPNITKLKIFHWVENFTLLTEVITSPHLFHCFCWAHCCKSRLFLTWKVQKFPNPSPQPTNPTIDRSKEAVKLSRWQRFMTSLNLATWCLKREVFFEECSFFFLCFKLAFVFLSNSTAGFLSKTTWRFGWLEHDFFLANLW